MGKLALDALAGPVEEVNRRPEQVFEVGLQPRIAEHVEQGVKDRGQRRLNEGLFREWPRIGLVLERAMANPFQHYGNCGSDVQRRQRDGGSSGETQDVGRDDRQKLDGARNRAPVRDFGGASEEAKFVRRRILCRRIERLSPLS
ncbi:hypothetical protein GGQ65_006862 [Rhizobium fabae]|uniref:Uncharacterized protein n=1 Tax=Rhizobium fabae TaxID=573179 RepID=A0A7W6BLK2_9HYPH|nr:hypothetical protein [Rhizobium fabae]